MEHKFCLEQDSTITQHRLLANYQLQTTNYPLVIDSARPYTYYGVRSFPTLL